MFSTLLRSVAGAAVVVSTALHGENMAENDFVAILDDATAAVTKSKLNVDYTPSVVSVLTHKEMNSLGIKTLFEALSILPGVETSVNQLGVKKVVIRGFDNPNNYTFDKSLLLIDGVKIEMAIFGNPGYYLDLPIDVIERVELLRGPGSALYGPGAINGVISVTTRQTEESGNGIFFSAGSDDYYMGGLRQHYQLGEKTTLHADVYYQKSNKMIDAGNSFVQNNVYNLETFEPIVFPREPQSNEQFDDYSLAMSLTHKQWNFKARYKENEHGSFFGWDEWLELTTDKRSKQSYLFLQAEYSDKLSASTLINAQVGYSRYQLKLDVQDYAMAAHEINIPYEIQIDEKEQTFYTDVYLTALALQDHTIVGGIHLESMQQINNSIYDDISGLETRPLIEEGLERNIIALYARDSIAFSDDLSALLALRFDYYTKEKKIYPSAQAGIVYSANEAWNLKLNYGHAFRVPSWLEQYTVEYEKNDGIRPGNPDLVAETTDTFEAIAIYNYNQIHHLQGNVYYSIINNVIDIDNRTEGSGYANYSDRRSYGLELDYGLNLYQQDRFNVNFSYNNTDYTSTDVPADGHSISQTMPGVAQIMIKGYYLHYFMPYLSMSALVKHIGSRQADLTNSDRDLDPYTTVDLTMNVSTDDHWDLHFSVKNLFDEDVRYPSHYSRHEEGIPREGINYLFQGEYTF